MKKQHILLALLAIGISTPTMAKTGYFSAEAREDRQIVREEKKRLKHELKAEKRKLKELKRQSKATPTTNRAALEAERQKLRDSITKDTLSAIEHEEKFERKHQAKLNKKAQRAIKSHQYEITDLKKELDAALMEQEAAAKIAKEHNDALLQKQADLDKLVQKETRRRAVLGIKGNS